MLQGTPQDGFEIKFDTTMSRGQMNQSIAKEQILRTKEGEEVKGSEEFKESTRV